MRSTELISASGLRPLSAFVVIGVVVTLVGIRVGVLSFASDRGNAPIGVREEIERAPAYDIEDGRGRPLARFIPRMELVVSPRSIWQAHTPRRIADGLAQILASETEAGTSSQAPLESDDILKLLLPDMQPGADLDVDHWEIEVADLSLSAKQAVRIAAFVQRGRAPEEEDCPLPGIEVVRDDEQLGRYRLRWRPLEVLSQETREAQGLTSPIRFSRFLADGLAEGLLGSRSVRAGMTIPEITARRREVWSRLMPCGHVRAIEGLDPQHALAVQAFLRSEKIAPHQMQVLVERERAYPQGRDIAFLGDWGFLPSKAGEATQTEPRPRSGLERRCFELLSEPRLSGLFAEGGGYRYVQTRPVRRGHAPRSYFVQSWDAGVPPSFRTTVNVGLQRYVHQQLEELLAEHRPAVAMAIVVDVASGAVLALDSVREYEVQDFAPAQHQFTPGSTFKLVTMALALEEGVVRPDEKLDVGNGAYRLVEHREDGSVRGVRMIHEAEGHQTGVITAAECVAHSMNAGLVQIGVRVDSPRFRSALLELGYGSPTALGFGGERRGVVPPLGSNGKWKYRFTHASICFGHEILTNLVQHAQSLATILRGGRWKPLYLLDSVEAGDQRVVLRSDEERRVFSEQTCAEVREMMRLGAREGTGRKIWREGLDMGTKTGTAEKIQTEVCVHVYEQAAVAAARAGKPFGSAEYRKLPTGPSDDHRSCYTSSICIVGKANDFAREIMVLVVADEPRGSSKYGSDVAGATGIAILEEAVGRTREGRAPIAAVVPGFAPSSSTLANTSEEPWAEELR